MKKTNSIEYILMSSVGFLLFLGLIIITSVSVDTSLKTFDTPYYYLIRHLLYIVVGVFAGYCVSRIKIEFIKKYSLVFLLLNMMALVIVFFSGFSAGGATRWLVIGPFMIQPSEFIKLTFLIYLCSWLSKIPEKTNKKSHKKVQGLNEGLLFCLALFLISAFFFFCQPDLSSLMVFFITCFVVYFLARTPVLNTVIVGLISIVALVGSIIKAPYRMERILVFLNPGIDPQGIGYQMNQASIAIGSGGLFGLGLGMSRQKLGFLPEPMNDAVFAVFSEETGFLGATLIILLLLAFFWSGLTIARKSSDHFSFLLASGITVWIIVQSFVNIGAMLGLLPLTGIPLPFLSYGGSHLLAELVAVGLLVNISKNKS
jgi:cell division protein FtsW